MEHCVGVHFPESSGREAGILGEVHTAAVLDHDLVELMQQVEYFGAVFEVNRQRVARHWKISGCRVRAAFSHFFQDHQIRTKT